MTRSIPATFVLSALLSTALAGCGDAETSTPPVVTPSRQSSACQSTVAPADSTQLASDNAAFAFDVYKQLITTNTNLIFSPASISIALAIPTPARLEPRPARWPARFTSPCHPRNCTRPFDALDLALTSRGQGKLGADGGPMQVDIVNTLWAEKTYAFRSDFLDTLAANYGAGVNLLDFLNALILRVWPSTRGWPSRPTTKSRICSPNAPSLPRPN